MARRGWTDSTRPIAGTTVVSASRCAPSPTSSVRRDVAGRASGADAREPSAPWASLARSRCKPLGFARWATRRRPPRRAGTPRAMAGRCTNIRNRRRRVHPPARRVTAWAPVAPRGSRRPTTRWRRRRQGSPPTPSSCASHWTPRAGSSSACPGPTARHSTAERTPARARGPRRRQLRVRVPSGAPALPAMPTPGAAAALCPLLPLTGRPSCHCTASP